MFDIITIGSATRDVFLFVKALHTHQEKDAVSKIETCLPFGAKIDIEQIAFDTGGGATNNAATLARLGKFTVAALTCVGDDIRGRAILDALKKDRINTALVQITKKDLTAYSTILSPFGTSKERTILVYRGASAHFKRQEIPWNKLRARWFYISSLGGDLVFLRKLLAHAKKIGAQVAWNPGGQEIERIKNQELRIKNWVDFLIVNREEVARLTGLKFENTKGLLYALARITPAAVMTDGPKGAYALLGDQGSGVRGQKSNILKPKTWNLEPCTAYYVPSVGHQPKNLTGAGDAFGSGFVTGWIKSHEDIKYALRLASFNADSVVQKVGAKSGILKKLPSLKQLRKLPVQEIKV